MRWGDQIKLIAFAASNPQTNEHGFPVENQEAASIVFANKKSVGYAEFYKASQAGYKAELKFDVRSLEYTGQEVVEYPVDSGKRYKVLRTYEHTNGELVELTLVDFPEAEGGGTHGGI